VRLSELGPAILKIAGGLLTVFFQKVPSVARVAAGAFGFLFEKAYYAFL
jgi:hypothetical protein